MLPSTLLLIIPEIKETNRKKHSIFFFFTSLSDFRISNLNLKPSWEIHNDFEKRWIRMIGTYLWPFKTICIKCEFVRPRTPWRVYSIVREFCQRSIVWVPRLHIYEAIYMTDKLCKMFVTNTNVQVNNLNGHATFYNGIYIISTKTQRDTFWGLNEQLKCQSLNVINVCESKVLNCCEEKRKKK